MAAIGVVMGSGLRRLRRLVRVVGVGVGSGVAKRELRREGGVATEERRPRRRGFPGEENVLPIGLDMDSSSGDDGPVGLDLIIISKHIQREN